MGSATSKIASKWALPHLAAGPTALMVAFMGNTLLNLILGSQSILQPTGWALIFGGITLFLFNYLLSAFYTLPSAMEERCGKDPSVAGFSRFLYPLWPALFSAIGDPNIVSMIVFGTPLIILAPIIIPLLPPGPLTVGISMLLRTMFSGVPVIGTIIDLFPLTKIFDLLTSSWLFVAALFLIGYSFWSWVGAAIANTQALNNNCT
jgi:hypothetical protein